MGVLGGEAGAREPGAGPGGHHLGLRRRVRRDSPFLLPLVCPRTRCLCTRPTPLSCPCFVGPTSAKSPSIGGAPGTGGARPGGRAVLCTDHTTQLGGHHPCSARVATTAAASLHLNVRHQTWRVASCRKASAPSLALPLCPATCARAPPGSRCFRHCHDALCVSPVAWRLTWRRYKVVVFFFNVCLFLRDRIETEREQGRGREGNHRIRSRLRAVSAEPDAGLKPMNCQMVT